jgi:hypothetical protein
MRMVSGMAALVARAGAEPSAPRGARGSTVVADERPGLGLLVSGLRAPIMGRAQRPLARRANAPAHCGKILSTLLTGERDDLGHFFGC